MIHRLGDERQASATELSPYRPNHHITGAMSRAKAGHRTQPARSGIAIVRLRHMAAARAGQLRESIVPAVTLQQGLVAGPDKSLTFRSNGSPWFLQCNGPRQKGHLSILLLL